jgi:hypothetical protein
MLKWICLIERNEEQDLISTLSFEQMGEGSSAATTTVGVVMTFKRRHTTKLF